MTLLRLRCLSLTAGLAVSLMCGGRAIAQDAPPPDADPATAPAENNDDEQPVEIERRPVDPILLLLKEVEDLRMELQAQREALAKTAMRAEQAERELAELRQFIDDNRQFGDDFKQYQAVKEIAEREDQRKVAEQNRAKRDAEKAQRAARRQMALEEKARRDAVSNQMGQYRRAGFTLLGLDVYASKMAFFYESSGDGGGEPVTRYDYVPELGGTYLRAYPPTSYHNAIDYSEMTISGSVINGADEVRNIGVAITFFDENGNQVGHETVQVTNARPDVPYPFTSKINMALNRPFDSSSTYVLYADSIDDVENPAPAELSNTPAPADATQQPGGYQRP